MKWIKAIINFLRGGEKPTPVTPPKDKPVLRELVPGARGLDISHHNDVTNMKKVLNQIDFLYMKATEGETFVSKTYNERVEQIKDSGVPWGAYHYYKTNADPVKQADHFLKYIDPKSGLPPVLDVESINNNFKKHVHTEHLLIILERIEQATGIKPIVYTNYYFWKDNVEADERFKKYDLWLAWYTKDFSRVKIPAPWTNVKMWQYTSKGKLEGIDGHVDLNVVLM